MEHRSLLARLAKPVSFSPFENTQQWIRSLVARHFETLARRRMAATALAILLFERDHGRRPSTLAELVPDYLLHAPLDPCAADGAVIQYRADVEHPVLYSIGRNGVDDGGETRLESSGMIIVASSDIVFDLGGRKEEWGQIPSSRSSAKAVDHDQDPEDGEGEQDEEQAAEGDPE